ncbi:NAD(P)/FAD-dependent oxidoreductase [Bradyrhizobium prioriisuperbiae]|uniref:NAD(P)/FAD-dependent oxidoreductase n=1 Tax=Bradyrhizobium prioriisuperbiae TaxID=2854389 RepID=UPI003898F51E
MFSSEETRHADLRGGTPPWQRPLQPFRPPPEADIRCDVAIVGAGITGSLAAEHLTSRGLQVCVIDQQKPGLGSTAASTSMLQWEIDNPLRDLASRYGFERAARAYHYSLAAASGLVALANELGIPCQLRPRHSIYLAAGDVDARQLMIEHDLRRRANLPGEFIPRTNLMDHFGFDRDGAIVSPGSADADPLQLASGLLAIALSRQAIVCDAQAVAYHDDSREAIVELESGHVVAARHVVLATGYALPDIVKPQLHQIASSWAIATAVQPPGTLWRDGMLVWEASTDYHYARTTTDGRIVFGVEDDDQLTEPDKRDGCIPAKSATLARALASLRPDADTTIDYAWAGAFGKTDDGLPLIGLVPGHPRIYGAFGYGGNGITFSYLASLIIARMIAGDHRKEFDDFALDRAG